MSRPPETHTFHAMISSRLSATLGTPRLLRYDHGAHPLEDLPGHVRGRRTGATLAFEHD